MEQIKLELEQLFDEMIQKVRQFRRKTYDDMFTQCRDKHKGTMQRIESLLVETSEDIREELIKQVATIIPQYALEKTQKLSKRQKDRDGIDYNMNMAVFIVPLFTYEHQEYGDKIADEMILLWNELDVTGLTLGKSSYEGIVSGFRKGLCYITTAVCESQQKADDCYELSVLRGYRDHYLMKTDNGRELVEEYYEIAPILVQIIDMHKSSGEIYEEIYIDYLLPCIKQIEAGEPEACRQTYMGMVTFLETKYMTH